MTDISTQQQQQQQQLGEKRPRPSLCQQQEDDRLRQRHRHQQHEQQETEEEEEQQQEQRSGCFCASAACPWQQGIRSTRRTGPASSTMRRPMTTPPPSTPARGHRCYESDSDGEEGSEVLQPEQFFDGPLLSVKEYRDRRTGDVRFAVFQGDRRVSVAQILFSLKHEKGEGGTNRRSYGHVKSVKVAQDFRGMGLGPLLFKELFTTLGNLSVTEVRLEAEEDMGKYNRLVRYYEDLGFRQLEGSKVHYVHHCDQVYRKIPMLRRVSAPPQLRSRRSPRLIGNGWFLVVRLQLKATSAGGVSGNGVATEPRETQGGESGGTRGGGTYIGEGTEGGGRGGKKGGGRRAADDLWTLMVHEVRGTVCFESSYGKYLCAEPDGKVVANRSWDNSWEQFSLEKFGSGSGSGGGGGSSSAGRREGGARDARAGTGETASAGVARGNADSAHAGEQSRDAAAGAAATFAGSLSSSPSMPPSTGAPDGATSSSSGGGSEVSVKKDRFALRTYHGQYLSLDAECGTVSASTQPVVWTTDEKNAICHCEGAVSGVAPPPASRRQLALQAHLRSMRQVQSVSFVTGVREKYLGSFGKRGRFSVKYALDLLDRHHDDPLQSARLSKLSLAGLMVLTAEDLREEGMPDWMQAIGLVHGLGRILHFLGQEEGADVTPTERECALGEYSWVVGAPLPNSIACPSYNVHNDDARDDRYRGGPTGMYDESSGLESALLCFTGPEYMHMVLRNHGVSRIPPEGMAMLRLYPLEPWHAGDDYAHLESPDDREMKNAVRQFDAIRRATLHSVTVQRRDANLELAWHDHLRDLVDKFFPGDLAW